MNPRLDSRGDPKKSSWRLSILFIIFVLVLSIIRSSQVILVIALYLCLLFAGISLAVFIMYSLPDWNAGNFTKYGDAMELGSKGTDVVSSLNVYVKFASRGSGHSRREIAYMLKNIVANMNFTPNLQNPESVRRLEKDMNEIVYPYLSDSPGNSKAKNLGFRTKASKEERIAYLESLERIVGMLSNQSFT